jgi:hypothetical protein
MKKTLLSLTAVAAVLSASAAFADSQQLYVDQIGDGHLAEVGQTGLYNYAYVFQNGSGERAIAVQFGQNNSLTASQGLPNAANDSSPHAYETSSAGEFLSSIQNGDSNIAKVTNIGLNNSTYVTQVGNSNSINAYTNDNISVTDIRQTGYLNSVVSHQGI